MMPAARDWLAGLRRFSEAHRAPRPGRRVPVPSEPSPDDDSTDRQVPADPPGSAAGVDTALPDAAVLPAAVEGAPEGADAAPTAEARILAGWLEDRGARLVASTLAARPDAVVAFTTTPTGFPAAERLLATLSSADVERVAIVTELEYRGWCRRSPDEAFALHENLWSWVKAPVPRRRRGEFADWPIHPTHRYWLHRQGRSGAAGEWRSADLWEWDGAVATLLTVGVTESARRPG